MKHHDMQKRMYERISEAVIYVAEQETVIKA